jgi:hypothetical protein
MDPVSIKINGLTFDRANYDADGDVLYLARGESREAADAALTPEGHGVRYDDRGTSSGSRSSMPAGCSTATTT